MARCRPERGGKVRCAVLDVFVPGVLCLLAFGAGMGAGWVVIFELDAGVIERLRVTPASRFALLMGTVLRDIVMLVVPALIVIAVAIPFGYRPDPGGVAVLLVLLSLLTAIVSAWSSALGLILRQIGSLAAVVTGLQLPLRCSRGCCCRWRSHPGGCGCSRTSTRSTTQCKRRARYPRGSS